MKIMQLEHVEQLTTGGDEVAVGKKWYFSTLVTTVHYMMAYTGCMCDGR